MANSDNNEKIAMKAMFQCFVSSRILKAGKYNTLCTMENT